VAAQRTRRSPQAIITGIVVIIAVMQMAVVPDAGRFSGNVERVASSAMRASADTLPSTPSSCDSSIICPGEDLLYEVSWWVFKLGTIRLKTLQTKVKDDQIRYSVAVFIDSYPGLPFADVHAIDYAEMDTAFNSRGFSSVEKRNDEWLVMNYHYRLAERLLVVEQTWQKDLLSAPYKPSTFDTLQLVHGNIQDGLSLVYFARHHVRRKDTVRVPTIAYARVGSTTFFFSGKRELIEIDKLDRPLRTVVLEGKAEFEGIFGLTGDFQGWFSDDAAAVPIKAKMKVILGWVNIELIEWDRPGWSPPIRPKR
jgi:hypothetical protein